MIHCGFVEEPIRQSEHEAEQVDGEYDEPSEDLSSTSVADGGFHLFAHDHESIDAHRHDQVDARELKEIVDGREPRHGLVNKILVPRFTIDNPGN